MTIRKTAAGAAAATRQRRIQAAQAGKTSAKKKDASKPVQAGARTQPTSPMPAQHQRKPGIESRLRPRPRFLAPDYRGSGKLDGMNAIITGGDSGIGRAVAVLFAREGANVAIVYLSETADASETKKYVEKEGGKCILIAGDVSDAAFCKRAVAATRKAFGGIDILVNNAAFQLHSARIEDLSDAHFDLTMRTNIYGYFNMAKQAIPYLKRGSAIINTGSETGFFGAEQLLDYSATKGAIHAFTRSLAKNLLPRGIRVNAVAPGPVWTPLNPSDRSAKEVRRFGADSDMGRPGQPEEISPAYVFLASPVCSGFMTGSIIPIFGGVAPGG